jgi:hypothetical protein
MRPCQEHRKTNTQGKDSEGAFVLRPLTRCHRAGHFLLRCCCRGLSAQFHSDTAFVTKKLLKGNKCAQVFTAKDFIRAVDTQQQVPETAQLWAVFTEFEKAGVPLFVTVANTCQVTVTMIGRD